MRRAGPPVSEIDDLRWPGSAIVKLAWGTLPGKGVLPPLSGYFAPAGLTIGLLPLPPDWTQLVGAAGFPRPSVDAGGCRPVG